MSRSISSLVVLWAVSAGCVVSLTACSDNSVETADSPEFSAVASSSTTASSPTHSEKEAGETGQSNEPLAGDPVSFPGLGTASFDEQHHLPPRLGQLTPTEVRVGEHDGFTRVVIDLEGDGEPGWFTAYTDDPRQQASGLPVDVNGGAFLNLGIEGTPFPDNPQLEEKHMMPGVTPGVGIVSEVVYTTSFEAQTQLIIGVQKKTPYSVTFLDEPKRLVLDFQD